MTLQSPTTTLIPLFSSSELTGCGYPGLLGRKNRSDMCPQWESNLRLPACKASTLSTRPGSLLLVYSARISILYIVQVFVKTFILLSRASSSCSSTAKAYMISAIVDWYFFLSPMLSFHYVLPEHQTKSFQENVEEGR